MPLGRSNDTVNLIRHRRTTGEHAVGRGIANRPPKPPRFPVEPLTGSERIDHYTRDDRALTPRQRRRIEKKNNAATASRRRSLRAALHG